MIIIIFSNYYRESGDFIPKILDHNSPDRRRRRRRRRRSLHHPW
jgi:hypothetical protein